MCSPHWLDPLLLLSAVWQSGRRSKVEYSIVAVQYVGVWERGTEKAKGWDMAMEWLLGLVEVVQYYL